MTELEKAADDYATSNSIDQHTSIELYRSEQNEDHEYTKSVFAAGAEWQAKQSPWISVEGRLPEKDGLRVWVKSNCLNEQPLVYWKGKFYARLSDGCYDGSVTHWMPIPE